MVEISFTDLSKSKICQLIFEKLPETFDSISFEISGLDSDGYPGQFVISHTDDDQFFSAFGYENEDLSRFPQRVRAVATAMKEKAIYGHFFVSHSRGVFEIIRISNFLWLHLNSARANAKFFIFDTGKKEHRDEDFRYYTYNKTKFNKVQNGDLFVYRTPKNSSKIGEFYFFGAGRIFEVREAKPNDPQFTNDGDIFALLDNPIPFDNAITQSDISPSDLNDTRKAPKSDWNHFFSQYGMKEIPLKDYCFLVDKGLGQLDFQPEFRTDYVNALNNVADGDYSAEDKSTNSKSRGGAQKVFSDTVKLNYGYRCAVTGIKNKSLLIGAHIIPWSKDKQKRLDPRNGLCLSVLIDKCYELNLIGIAPDFTIFVSEKAKADNSLYEEIKKYEGKKINLPGVKENHPALENIEYKWNEFIRSNR